MKKILVAFVLLAGVTAVAYASYSNKKQKAGVEKKMEKKKKSCSRSCMFS